MAALPSAPQRSSGLLKRMKILKKALANTRFFD